ncbi:MAG TPA: hypothetical protein GX709_00815 [Clostridiales bacterium]|nr:hypothetical protein [Clostridiales bacterium]
MNDKNTFNYYKNRKLIKKIDIIFLIILIIVIVISIVLIFTSKEGKKAKVVINSEIQGVYDLNKNQIIELNDYNVVIKIEEEKISIIESNCPNQICVNTGEISKSNQIIVCAPKKILIVIEEDDKSNYYTGNIG